MARKGLGKGLDVLIGSAAAIEGQQLEDIPVEYVKPNPRQPRQTIDDDSIEDMARSVAAYGILQPIIVRPIGTEYELVAGERRWRAAKFAGLEKIPAIIRGTTETASLEMALIENLHRVELTGVEEALAYQQLLEDFSITHEELSIKLGKSRTAITNSLRLLQLPEDIQLDVLEGIITAGHARALLSLQDMPEEQAKLHFKTVEKDLSVRQVEEQAMKIRKGKDGSGKKQELPSEVVMMTGLLEEKLETRVRSTLGKRKGKLIIEFKNIKDLQRIFKEISPELDSDTEIST